MKFWQLISVLRGEERIIAAAAGQEPDWAKFGDWLADFHGIVRDQERDKLDFELPPAFVRAVLGRSSQRYFVSANAYLRYHRRRDDDQAITALDAFDRYGGTALEEAQEYGSWPITAGLHREPEWAPPETGPEAEPDTGQAEAVQPVRDAIEPAAPAPVQTDAAGGEPQMDDSPHADSQGSDSQEFDSETESEAWEIDESAEVHVPWPLRPLLLALLGLATGLAIHFLLGDDPFYRQAPTAWVLAQATAITVAAGLIGFTIERRLWWAALAFALAMGALAGAVIWWNGGPQNWNGGDGWRTFSLFLGVAIAAPLFQAARDTGRLRFPYGSVHDHAWTNVVLWFACWIFVGIVFALAWLLAGLFDLIKLTFLMDLLRENWFGRALCGLAFGGGLGLLREHDVVVRLLQRVVATVLAVLAPVLAAGLVLFVAALPFTGLNALWDATKATTPLLLFCIVGALILANAVIGNAEDQERRFPVLRYAAMALAVVMLPLAAIAAIATGLRIGQYGFTPDRLWALTFVIVACAYGLAYLVSLVRGRLEWADKARPANLVLAFALGGLALVLATPLISFNAISTRDQVARLESGKLTPEKFDWRALAFDFGQPGREAVMRLQASKNVAIAAKAKDALKADSRWDLAEAAQEVDVAAAARGIRVLPQGKPLPPELLDRLARNESCGADRDQGCTVYLVGDNQALLFRDNCYLEQKPGRMFYCRGSSQLWLVDGKWTDSQKAVEMPEADQAAQAAAYKAGEVEVRTVERRQVFVGGKPVGSVFE